MTLQPLQVKVAFKEVAIKEEGLKKTADLLQAEEIADTKIALTYKLRVIKGALKLPESPLWLQIQSLWNSGIRPVNNVVDVTNYILLKYGQPLHSYDYDQLSGKNFGGFATLMKVKSFVTLDGDEQTLKANDIVGTIIDQPVALAGT